MTNQNDVCAIAILVAVFGWKQGRMGYILFSGRNYLESKFELYGLLNLFFYLEWEDWVPGSKEAYMDYNVLFLL